MYITNLEEVVHVLRARLRDYLVIKLGIRANARKFKCFVHNDNDPSMYFNPKTDDQTVKCFSCGWSGDIFAVAAILENLPSSGPEWITQTIPSLAETLNIPIKLGEPSLNDKEKVKFYKLTQDICDIISIDPEHDESEALDYARKRNWVQDTLTLGSVDEDELIAKLAERGWDANEINRSMLIRNKYISYFGKDKINFIVRDQRGRPVGFITRSISDSNGSKYINTSENPIYDKSRALLGLDVAIKEGKKSGIYIVEGPGDLAQLHRLGITNAVAVCGTAFTEQHLLILKSLGIRKLFLSFDWDNAGYLATQRVLENTLKATNGVSAFIVMPPENPCKDPDECLSSSKDPDDYLTLIKTPAFEWILSQASENDSPDIICSRMIPTIAAEEAAVKREMLIETLAQFTNVSHQAISSDVMSLRSNKYAERLDKLKLSADKYLQAVTEDPDNIKAHVGNHEQDLNRIEKEYKKNTVGINYQIARFEAIQELREVNENDEDMASFKMGAFSVFEDAMSGGMSWTRGCLIYVGGRANSGKTAVCLYIGCDIALSDPNALVIIHSTDDSYEQIEPRIKTNLYKIVNPTGPKLTIGMVVQPHVYLTSMDQKYHEAYEQANSIFRDLISEEKLIIVDAEDGATLTVLERNLRYYRQRYPERKIMVICDNTHNYMDFMNSDQTSRMTQISNQQKSLCTKYHACFIATAEYRKNMPMDNSKLRLPVDDDLADARALMYRPNAIFHVYNDMHDRKEHAEIFWTDEEGKINPRLLLHFTKNKISGYKEKLVLDLDPKTVSLKPKSNKIALTEAEDFRDAKEQGRVQTDGTNLVYIQATEFNEAQK